MSQQQPPPDNAADAGVILSPPWLNAPTGAAYMASQSLIYNGLDDVAKYAVRARFPHAAPDDALPFAARDRQIIRGPNESRASYESRLIQWLDLWRVAGSALSVINAIAAHLIPGTYDIETVNDTITDPTLGPITAWNVQLAGETTATRYLEDPGNWDWDMREVPGRSWLIIFTGPWDNSQTWGDGTNWGSDGVWGFSGTVADRDNLRVLAAKWISGGAQNGPPHIQQRSRQLMPYIIIAFDTTWFLHGLPPGDAKLPDGLWGRWGKVEGDATAGAGATMVSARTTTACYVRGVP